MYSCFSYYSRQQSGIMKLTSESNQWYTRGQKTAIDPSVLTQPLQSNYFLVYGRLQTSTMQKLQLLDPKTGQKAIGSNKLIPWDFSVY